MLPVPTKAMLGRALVERYVAADAEVLENVMSAAEGRSDNPAKQIVAPELLFGLPVHAVGAGVDRQS